MLLNKWWVSLNFFFHCRSSLAWTQKEPEACMCIRCRQKEGGTQWARSPACLFSLVFLLSFLILSHPSAPTRTPPPHTHILVSWRLNPEGRDLLSHTRTCGSKSTWRIPVAVVLSLSSPFLAQKAAGVAEMHSRANILKSTYLVQEPEGQFLWVGKWYRDCREEIKKKIWYNWCLTSRITPSPAPRPYAEA